MLYVGTSDGLIVLRARGLSLQPIGHIVHGNAVRGIAPHPDDPRIAYVACGLRGWGLHRTRDAGRASECLGFADRWVWDVLLHPRDPATIWVGTEPPMIYASRDQGHTFHALEGIERLPSRRQWSFFYEPFRAGHIHGLAIHPDRPERLFAGVEHGALIYTHDGGETWHEALVGADLHRIAIDPLDPDHVLAGTGEGLFASRDAGAHWEAVAEFSGKYVHGISFDPRDPRRLYVYTATEGNPLHRSEDGGGTWQPIADGLPANGPADCLAIHPSDSRILFYGAEVQRGVGRLFVSLDDAGTWQPVDIDLPKIWRLRAAPDFDDG